MSTYRLDLAYEHAKIAIEYDGEEFHIERRGSGTGRGAPGMAARARLVLIV